jgi:hypothetical protein
VVELGLASDGNLEGWHIDELAIDTDVSLSDDTSSSVVGLGHFALPDDGLESPVKELVDGETQHVIKLVVLLSVEETELEELLQESSTLKDSSWIVWLKGEELSCSLSKLSKSQLNSPNLSLVLETVLTADLDPTLPPSNVNVQN